VHRPKPASWAKSLKFKYRPGLVTPEAFSKLQTMDDLEELGVFLSELLVSWDLTKGDRELPITPETFATLPIQLIRAVIAVIMEDVPQGEAGKA
jgi:hypothetical protein